MNADVVRQVGITSVWAARIWAVAAVIIVLAILWVCATLRKVPGRGPLLRLISTRRGYASLSQFQILLWSFLIGAGAVYVMVLSGSLIDIPVGALWLLGISGAATVGSKIQSVNTDARAATATAVPGPVTGLATSNLTDVAVTLSWTAPATTASAGQTAGYNVEYQDPAAAPPTWIIAGANVNRTNLRVTGLKAGTMYNFKVTAMNAAGPSAMPATINATTLAQPPVPAPVSPPPRAPTWADLVVTPSIPGEIDVTRVQMLFFTLISAAFVGMKLFNSYVIPDIPDNFLLLMGISNGVYLTSKYVSSD